MKKVVTKRTKLEDVSQVDMFKLHALMKKRFELAQKFIALADADESTTKIVIELGNVTAKIQDMILFDAVKSKYGEHGV